MAEKREIPAADIFYMKQALKLAEKARGMTSPNPLVGAVLVKAGKVVAAEYHKRAGDLHAEALALLKAGKKAGGSTLYVTLEPCCHTAKKTPPCCPAILSAGVKRVVVAMRDPNPKVSGMGLKTLRDNGIEVVEGILEDKAARQNEVYCKFIRTGRPFVTLKCAMTLDGKIADAEGESKWITGEKARRVVQKMRGASDSVLTAIGTVLADNPRLTCRIGPSRQPARIVVDTDLDTPIDFNLTSTPPRTIFVTSAQDCPKRELFRDRGIEFISFSGNRVDLPRLMEELGSRGITSTLIEAGSSFSSEALMSGVVDKVVFFIAPKIIGGARSIPAIGGDVFLRLADAIPVSDMSARMVGEDLMVEGYVDKDAGVRDSR
jgi:diaminohydroxyphosphoribosylaminopyrimidine deaminase/5-amino-6-(5-phosphoribosylamino)uracil reductase